MLLFSESAGVYMMICSQIMNCFVLLSRCNILFCNNQCSSAKGYESWFENLAISWLSQKSTVHELTESLMLKIRLNIIDKRHARKNAAEEWKRIASKVYVSCSLNFILWCMFFSMCLAFLFLCCWLYVYAYIILFLFYTLLFLFYFNLFLMPCDFHISNMFFFFVFISVNAYFLHFNWYWFSLHHILIWIISSTNANKKANVEANKMKTNMSHMN